MVKVNIAIAIALLAPSLAYGGDPTAHTAAMVRAARQVAAEPLFEQGVGAPMVDGVPTAGRFMIPLGQDTELACPYESTAAALVGCSYSDPNGRAINEPDTWSCLSPNQSPIVSALNLRLSWGEAIVATVATLFDDRAAMACNYNHFTENSALGSEYSAAFTVAANELDAASIPVLIAGPIQTMYCTKDTWDTYYSKVVNGLHYLQDMQTEHHAIGNQNCGPDNIIPTQMYNELFQFSRAESCVGFLADTLASATGVSPEISCDVEVVTQDSPRVERTTMLVLNVLCSIGFDLACMGEERTLRHHCNLPGSNKSLMCNGEAGDHSTAGKLYCEGEIYPGIGQDYLTPATEISVPALELASVLWQAVCKEPDDPCDSRQCDTWCKHSVPPDNPSQEVSGYCVNAQPDAHCAAHTCQCMSPTQCGAHGQPCCTGEVCNAPGDLCTAATGTCVASTAGNTCPSAPPPLGTIGAAGGDPHVRTFDNERYNIQAVGELTLTRDTTDGTEIQIRTKPWGLRNDVATIVAVAARVGSDIVAFYGDGTVRVNQVVTDIQGGETPLHDGSIFRRGPDFTIVWHDGTQLMLTLVPQLITLVVSVPDSRRGHMEGLLGNFDGIASQSLVTRDGQVLAPPISFVTFYGTYAESWRIKQPDSLFYYDLSKEETTETFTDRTFPHQRTSTQDLSDAARTVAMAVCQAAGVAADWFDDCILDVGVTGEGRVANDLAAFPGKVASSIDITGGTPAALDGTTVTFSVRAPVFTTGISPKISETVGPGLEFPAIQNLALNGNIITPADIDIGKSTIDIRYRASASFSGGTFNGYAFEFYNPNPQSITGVSIDPLSTTDIVNVPFTFDATNINVNMSGRTVTTSTRLVLDILY